MVDFLIRFLENDHGGQRDGSSIQPIGTISTEGRESTEHSVCCPVVVKCGNMIALQRICKATLESQSPGFPTQHPYTIENAMDGEGVYGGQHMI